MEQHTDYQHQLPVMWRHMIDALQIATVPVQDAVEVHLNKMKNSKLGPMICWETLLKSLAREEPFSGSPDVNGTLSFKPLMLHLANYTQTLLMSFISRHQQEISSSSVDQFTKVLLQHWDQHRNEATHNWSGLLVTSLSENVTSVTPRTDDSAAQGSIRLQRKRRRYKFAHQNQSVKENIVRSLESTSEIKDRISMINTWRELTAVHPLKHCGSPQPCSTACDPHSTEAVKSPEVDRFLCSTTHSDTAGCCSPLTCQTGTPREKQIRNNEDESCTDSQEVDVATLSEDLKVKVTRLKERWHQADSSRDPDDVAVFTLCNPLQVCAACQLLGLEGLPESGLALACRDLTRLDTELTHATCLCLVGNILAAQVLKSNQRVSRTVVQSATLFAKHFPQALIEGLLLPTLRDVTLDAGRADLVVKVIKNGLQSNHMEQLLKLYLDSGSDFTEDSLLVLQALLDAKITTSDDGIDQLVAALGRNAANFKSSLKFGKVLNATVGQYGEKLTETQVLKLTQVTDDHKTFFRKKIISALQKLE